MTIEETQAHYYESVVVDGPAGSEGCRGASAECFDHHVELPLPGTAM